MKRTERVAALEILREIFVDVFPAAPESTGEDVMEAMLEGRVVKMELALSRYRRQRRRELRRLKKAVLKLEKACGDAEEKVA